MYHVHHLFNKGCRFGFVFVVMVIVADAFLAFTAAVSVLSVAGVVSAVVIFDEGQLGHEALVGLAGTESMAYWQAMPPEYGGPTKPPG